MFATLALTTFLAALVARADVVPTIPGPGIIEKAGQTCHIAWDGDKNSTTIWKSTAIQLMTGSNFAMVHLTTVATNQDGTTDGVFDYPCPDVAPHSAIYFYQFSSPLTSTRTWTTRFAIAGADGATVPPPNAVQPGSGEAIPWGTGALKDPSKAVPPPAYLSGPSASTSANATTAGLTSATTSTAVSTASTANITTTSAAGCAASPSAPGCPPTSATPTTTAAANVTTAPPQQPNAAMGAMVLDRTVWAAVLVLVVSALGASVMP